MTIGIKAIASYVPEQTIDNVAQARAFGEPDSFVTEKLGAKVLPRMAAEEDTSDLCVKAVHALQAKAPDLDLDAIQALVVVTQNGDGNQLPHTAAVVQRKLDLPTHIAAFDLSLGCSGYIYGLYAVKGFLDASGLTNALLITADPYSKIIDPSDRVTSLLFGDAATVTWLGEQPEYHLGKVQYGTDGTGETFLQVQDGTLHMHGRQVFNFAATKVAPHIKSTIEQAGLNEDQVDRIIVHQGSLAIVDAIARRFKHKERFVRDIEQTGNTVSSSIPLLLEKYILDQGAQDQHIALSGFGVGFSWASAVLHRA
ncbi:3-oxoacyl-ACP synthase III family protein [Marinomonas ostreistagni]|uniref:3-oxoacyl-ACP synthase III family protein n=1 Tax=Marinomonas ostreistagni TaxID=359209 RepID=UPI00194EF07B|nr:ketoacyl-ACP synthase III [Marinomonas ostreistagni]MBM6551155.1 ketoacyl-ACP synthase III [Marinomonas ostreistagni]